jgi:catechol 2,3-dioxygenase-like lactoylglutathione lyase family enzyme
MIRGIHHVAISTPDLDRLAAFYTDVLGFEPVMSTGWRDRPIIDRIIGLDGSAARQVMLRAGNAYLELFEYSSPTPRAVDPASPSTPSDHGYTHFCIDVIDIDAEYARLSASGMTFHTSPPTVDELGNARLRAIYGRDPDGNIVELQEVLDPAVPFTLERTPMISGASAIGGRS